MLRCKKPLKIKKIAIVIVCLLIAFVIPVSAVYTSGNADTPRYVAPLRMDFEIFGTTAQLTPTISYSSGQSLTYDTFEEATQANTTVTSINRTNFGVSTLNNTSIDVSYRLKFNVTESVDNFTIKITAPMGIYDFAKYGIPQISVPAGYTCNVRVTYNERFTQSQSYTDDIAYYMQYVSTFNSNENIPLIRDYVTYNGVDHQIVGGVIINKYVATLEFVVDSGSDPMWGNAGYYQWNSVLNAYDEQLLEFFALSGDEIFLYNSGGSAFYVTSLTEGVVDGFPCDGIIFVQSSSDGDELRYSEQTNGNTFLVCSIGGDWSVLDGNGDNDVGYMGPTLTSIELRTIYFDENPYNFFDALDGISASETVSENCRMAFLRYFRQNSTYYESNPLQTVLNTDGVTYSFTDGDGGMYLHYYADRMLADESSSTIGDLYGFGYSNGFGSGEGGFNGDYAAWLSTAVTGFFEGELFPNFSLGGIMGIIVGFLLLLVFLKYFAGG